jgi:glycosyltransferase involved in cell wall biosynthesis
VSDIGAAPETIVPASLTERNYTGWVIPCRDAAAIAARVEEALGLAPQQRAALGARARTHVTAKFTLSRMQHATLAVYDELLETELATSFTQTA